MEPEKRLARALSDRYRIEREIGSGGMATVYLAEDLKHKRQVAIKVLRPELSAALGTERFHREIEVVAGLNHPNILGLHDSGEADGLLFFVMPFVEGESLRARLDRESSLTLQDAVRITREIGDALHFAHEHGLVHRDIKPENILFQAGHALVCDFGITQVADDAQDRLTRTGVAVGTVTYMSPEQLTDHRAVDRRADVYALGCLLHEMLTGEVAFPAPTPEMALGMKLTGSVTNLTSLCPDLPRTLEAVLGRALTVGADDRYPTAEAFTSALDEAITTGAVEKDSRRRRRRRILRRTTVGVGALLLGVVGWWVRTILGGPTMDRIAVLPFTNQRADVSQAFFVQGVHEDLLLELAKAGLRVINSASVARYANSDRPTKEIASELQVDGIVQGITTIEADHVSVQLSLVDGVSEEIRWVESFETDPRHIISLYHEATRALAQATGVRLGSDVLSRLGEAQEVDPQVYEALLQARFHWQKLTEEGFSTAMAYYELALQRDSLSAEAWVGIARIWGARAQMGLIPGTEANRQSQAAMARAATIDPSLSRVQAEMATRLTWVEWDWAGGKAAFERALEADPTDSPIRAYYSQLLLYLKQDSRALEEVQQAAQLDPFNTLVQGLYAMDLNFLHRYEEAEAVLLSVMERDPRAPIVLSTLRTTYHLLGRHEDAIGMWRATYETDPEALEALEEGYTAGGYSSALRAVADLFLARSASTYVRPWQIATLLTRAGSDEEAIAYLEQAFEEEDPNMPYISIDPIFDSMRSQPRFIALMDRLGLPR